ncbi:ATP-binding protein [Flagellimonas lutaonensis]|uniref:Type III restriction enzyme, res subunit n=1 Tax=Flagellimonas lutaonensis TaxID=516051 RepID=A0A0D5YVV1_9FLAO|nr:ATP-binding protein [Allomuricauda lutaonensis]AKA36016.1 Type III restriction enzyme, res subunit [Allomuricauda lutaonensis]
MKNKNTARPYADLKTPFIVDKNGAFAEYIVQEPEEMPDIALGATVIIRDLKGKKEFWIAGQIVGLRSISPFSPERENLLYLEPEVEDPTSVLDEVTGPHTHQPMIIRVSLEREMFLEKNSNNRKFNSFPVQRPPSARSRLYFPNIIPNDDDSPSLQEILDVRADGISFGMIGFGNTPYESSGEFLNYKWDIDKLDNKHIFVVGESGSGKTVFLKNLAYELRKHNKNNRVILTDVQGDIIQLLLPNVAEILKPSGWQTKIKVESVEDTIQKFKKFQLIIPARPEGTSPNLQALKKLAKNNGVDVKEIGLRLQDLSAPSDVEYLFRTSSEQVAMLLDDEAEYLKNHPSNPNPASIDNLRRMIQHLLNNNDSRQIPCHNGTSYYQSTYSAALRALRSLGQYFDYHQNSLNSDQMPLNYFDFDGTTILYLDELDQDERIMWEMQLVKWLYENKKQDWNAFVFFDEAHQIIPAKPSGIGAVGTFERLRINFEKLAREGRKFGINLVLSTQNPKDLHPIVPEQCPTRIVMKINPRNAKYSFLDDNLAMIANRFRHGQFWIQSPFNGTADWVRVHSVAPAIPHQPMTDFWRKAIDIASKTN